MNTDALEDLKKQVEEIDSLVTSNVITKERADEWKKNILNKFEQSNTLVPPPKEQVDVAHLPGRLVGYGVDFLRAVARGSGATYEGLSKQEGYLPDERGQKRTQSRARSPDEMMDNLPARFK